MRRGLEAYRRELKKQRFGVGCRPRRAPGAVAFRGKRLKGLEQSTHDTHDTHNAHGGRDAHDTHEAHRSREVHDAHDLCEAHDAHDLCEAHDAHDLCNALGGHGVREVAERRRRSRHVPAAVARAVYSRDDGSCTFCSGDGRRCGARRFLELDHVIPWAAGGASTVENLRLRCRAHNQHSARRYFGANFMRSKLIRVACVGQSRLDSL
jgi:hypothetical protein